MCAAAQGTRSTCTPANPWHTCTPLAQLDVSGHRRPCCSRPQAAQGAACNLLGIHGGHAQLLQPGGHRQPGHGPANPLIQLRTTTLSCREQARTSMWVCGGTTPSAGLMSKSGNRDAMLDLKEKLMGVSPVLRRVRVWQDGSLGRTAGKVTTRCEISSCIERMRTRRQCWVFYAQCTVLCRVCYACIEQAHLHACARTRSHTHMRTHTRAHAHTKAHTHTHQLRAVHAFARALVMRMCMCGHAQSCDEALGAFCQESRSEAPAS